MKQKSLNDKITKKQIKIDLTIQTINKLYKINKFKIFKFKVRKLCFIGFILKVFFFEFIYFFLLDEYVSRSFNFFVFFSVCNMQSSNSNKLFFVNLLLAPILAENKSENRL